MHIFNEIDKSITMILHFYCTFFYTTKCVVLLSRNLLFQLQMASATFGKKLSKADQALEQITRLTEKITNDLIKVYVNAPVQSSMFYDDLLVKAERKMYSTRDQALSKLQV